MKKEWLEVKNISTLLEIMKDNEVKRIFLKELSPNDNSKNQIYLGGDFQVINILPYNKITVDTGKKGSKRDRYKANIDLYWIDAKGMIAEAPGAQLILYPKYPEVRMSGMLRGSANTPSKYIQSRKEGRLLFMGIRNDGKILAHVTEKNSEIQSEMEQFGLHKSTSILKQIPFAVKEKIVSTKSQLIKVLQEIHLEEWIDSIRLKTDGTTTPCLAPNCGGYTLEAKLGIIPNGYAKPDYLGWEIKQHGVTSFEKPHSGSPITLMTPEPTEGLYATKGVEYFIRTYGYEDMRGRSDRLNFGGVYKIEKRHPRTGLTLELHGYNNEKGKIEDLNGGLVLTDDKENETAKWSFKNMMEHWMRKHAQAAYIPSKFRRHPAHQYMYGNLIELGEGTDFLLFLKAIAKEKIYYDPGIKLEKASTNKPKIKRRSQFRIKSADLCNLYKKFEVVNINEQ